MSINMMAVERESSKNTGKKQKDQSMVSLDGLVYNPNGGTF
jgi:hypothetical protein